MNSLIGQTIGFALLLLVGYLFGRAAEKRHYKRLRKREQDTQHVPVVASRFPPEDQNYHQVLVTGNVVIASDYFKTFLAGLIQFFGGRLTPFESMMDRARRESLLRMKDEAIKRNATYVFNVKYETTRIMGAIEMFAYGTAMIPVPSPSAQPNHGI